MDLTLRCNSLKCRTQLNDRAVVTTCSHVFCVPCSESLGLANANGPRVCPACETPLPNPDDAVVTQLNPTEDYKTSVLGGLSPSIIMECVSRGLAFYTYQTTQEITYQEYLARSLTEKYASLSNEMDKIIHDANTEIASLQDKITNLQNEQRSLEKKNQELVNAYKDKSKQHKQTEKLYNLLKQQQLAAGMELAAEHDAENVLQAAQFNTSAHRSGHRMQSRAGSGSGGAGNREERLPWEHHVQGARVGLQSSRSAPVPNTPSGHRTRLPGAFYHAQGIPSAAGDTTYHGTPYRSALNNIDPNVYGGMSAGVKVGRQPNTTINRNGSGLGRSTGVRSLNIR